MKALVESISGSQKHEHAIVFTVDTAFLPHALFVIEQISKIHENPTFDYIIVTQDDLPAHPLIESNNIRICCLNKEGVGADFPHSSRISLATYLRFYISRALKTYTRLLYLDSDLFIRRGDFSLLLSSDIGSHPMAGARDPVQFRHPNFHSPDMKGLKLDRFKYLSAGVQLIDTARYNTLRIGERSIELAVEKPEKMTVFDQTAINAVLKGNFAELPPVWNWLYGFRTIYFTELYNPTILHFAGRRKPWNTFGGEIPRHYIATYKAYFQQHFPDLARDMPEAKHTSANRLKHVRFLLNHLNGLRQFVPALDSFEHDFDIKK